MAALASSVGVVKPFDVILCEVLPYLYFDDFEWNLSPVFQSMPHSDGDVGTLVFTDSFNLFVAGNGSSTGDDNPVL